MLSGVETGVGIGARTKGGKSKGRYCLQTKMWIFLPSYSTVTQIVSWNYVKGMINFWKEQYIHTYTFLPTVGMYGCQQSSAIHGTSEQGRKAKRIRLDAFCQS